MNTFNMLVVDDKFKELDPKIEAKRSFKDSLIGNLIMNRVIGRKKKHRTELMLVRTLLLENHMVKDVVIACYGFR